MGLACRIIWTARVLVVFVVHVRMRMCHWLMGMLMMLAQMQPHTDTHQHTCEQ
jgi:hypothetical protein